MENVVEFIKFFGFIAGVFGLFFSIRKYLKEELKKKANVTDIGRIEQELNGKVDKEFVTEMFRQHELVERERIIGVQKRLDEISDAVKSTDKKINLILDKLIPDR